MEAKISFEEKEKEQVEKQYPVPRLTPSELSAKTNI